MIAGYPPDPERALEKIQTLDADELDKWLWKYPHSLQEMFRAVSNRYEDLFSDPGLQKASFALYRESGRKIWRGLWIGHIPADLRLLVISTLAAGQPDQETLNFLTLSDRPAARYKMIKAYDAPVLSIEHTADSFQAATLAEYQIDSESKALAAAFAEQMIEEAAPHRPGVILGHFVMERVDLPHLDNLIKYDALRLATTTRGLFGSLVKGENYLSFWWSPEVTTTWSLGAKPAWAINTMMACIWRDACVVRHKMMDEPQRAPYQKRPPQERRGHNKILRLPRIIRHCAWSSDHEREKITRAGHSVRAFYRQLPPGQRASAKAKAAARKLAQPDPPAGFTFVRPHWRGGESETGEIEATPVICRGLQVARLALELL